MVWLAVVLEVLPPTSVSLPFFPFSSVEVWFLQIGAVLEGSFSRGGKEVEEKVFDSLLDTAASASERTKCFRALCKYLLSCQYVPRRFL